MAAPGNIVLTTRTTVGTSARKPGALPAARGETGHETFEVDLREALASTVVRDASFEEFRRALSQYLSHSR